MGESGQQDSVEGLEIAVVGMAGRFPGARDVDEFWRNLRDGVESITFFSDEEALADGADPTELKQPGYVKANGVLEGAELFDAAHFGFYPREAEILDPQQRVFLECSWEALESAGYDPDRYAGAVGVYAGSGVNTYLVLNLLANRDLRGSVHPYQLTLANEKDFLATRASYKLNLKGPSVAIQTACSTSLVAVHSACQALLNGQCDLALAGGVSIRLPQKQGYLHQPGGIASPDGHCRAFDVGANGTVGGSGVGIVVLKRLADALAEGDTIRAVIRGSAVNNDGSLKVGFTAPSVDGQAEVIATAQFLAGVTPDTISYVEAHGTGTPMGDPIEVAALAQVFQEGAAQGSVAIGSLKTNIGHLDAAAGVAGLIKTVLSLEHGLLPPTLHFTSPNPKLGLDASPFRVNAALAPWPQGDGPRRAGVSSFGIGGTNAHVVLEEAPEPELDPSRRAAHLFTLSARTPAALDAATANFATYLRSTSSADAADVAFTLQTGRRAFPHRRTVVGRDLADVADALERRDPRRIVTGRAERDGRPVVLMFTGQGAQYPDMGRGLYETEPDFREEIDRCAELLAPHLGLDLRTVLYPGAADLEEARRRLDQTALTQPALFAVEYALAQLWLRWGVQPEAMIGHSIGEYVAACLAGVFTLEDALRVVAARGALMQVLPAGSMLGVNLAEDEARALAGDELDLAAVNAPGLCVLSGPADAVDAAERRLAEREVGYRRLRTSHAFHSRMMTPILEAFTGVVASVDLAAPRIPFISNVTGTWLSAAEATDPAYWTSHLRGAVRFADGVRELLSGGERIFLEVGPGKTLGTLARMQVEPGARHVAIASLREPRTDDADECVVLGAMGQLWAAGAALDWLALYGNERRRRVPLPTYPFERQRFWIAPDGLLHAPGAAPAQAVKRPDPADWLYLPSWRRAAARSVEADVTGSRSWLVFADGAGGDTVVAELRKRGDRVTVVTPGAAFAQVGECAFTVEPGRSEDYDHLLTAIAETAAVPDAVVHLWGTAGECDPDPARQFEAAQVRGFGSVLRLAQALARRGAAELELIVVSSHTEDVTGDELLWPERAPVLGLCRVLPQEYPTLRCRTVDIEASLDDPSTARRLVAELRGGAPDAAVALRGRHRWVQAFEAARPAERAEPGARLRARGVYLVTGGLGRIGLLWAEYLARSVRARLVLVGRSAVPPRPEWEAWLAEHGTDAPMGRTLARLLACEAMGAEIEVATADVADAAQLAAAIALAERRFGALHGVIHAAGSVGHEAIRPIPDTGPEDCARQFHAKAHGLLTLEAALGARPLDFCLLQSSLASVLGGLGFAAYAAANRFMDAFAQSRAQAGDARWTSVNWDGWRFDDDVAPTRGIAARAAAMAIIPDEASTAFDRLLAVGVVPQVVVSTNDLDARIARWAPRADDAPDEISLERATGGSLHPRPAIGVDYVEPRTALEREIVDTWQRVLGIDGIGAHDDFFELGGHSLLATQLVSRLRERFQVELPLAKLFETPTPAGLAGLVETVRGGAAADAPALATILPAPPGAEPVLSFAQQRLWFLEQLEPGSPIYNNPAAVRLTGPLDLSALEWSLQEIVQRHEVLRTSFPTMGGQVRVGVLDRLALPLRLVDLSALPADACEAEIQRRAAEEAVQPFDLAAAPLLRVTLLRLSEHEHVALLTMHHIVSDGWSVAVLVREIAALYFAFTAGRPSPLAPLPIQYADFAVWQRQWLQGEELARQLDYWTRQLRGSSPVLELPTDRPRGAVQTFAGSTRPVRLSGELVAGLRGVAQREDATLFMALLAAFQTLLYRYSGQEDLNVGTPIAGRNRGEVEGLIGFFVNTLVLRGDLSGEPGFRELLARTKAVALGAYDHQDLPFEQVVEALQPERDLSRTPLIQVMFTLQNTPPLAFELPGLRLERLETRNGTAKFDLSLTLEEDERGVQGVVEYNTDLYDGETIDRMIGHLEMLLRGVVADPDRPISTLPLLTAEEEQQLVSSGGYGVAVPPQDALVHLAISRQAERTPDAAAVTFGGVDLGYRALDERSNRLARYLHSRGVIPGTTVGLCVERSHEMVVGLLGILKAGAVYLPLDASYPADRIAYMLDDARAPLVLTQRHLEGVLAGRDAEIVCLDAEWDRIGAESADAPADAVAPEDPAYLIYTSGSTGRPKGVVVSHGSLAAHCADMRQHFALAPNDRVLQFAAINFDPSLEQILPTLMAGARVVLRDVEPWLPADFQRQVATLGLTVVNVPPAYWQQWTYELARSGEQAIPAPDLRLVIVGGDLLPVDVLGAWLGTPNGRVRLLNAYGPTETTITAATFEVPFGFDAGSGRVPIGRPRGDRVFHVLDRRMQRVPLGVPGELYIGGGAVAIGYLGREELTAERFVRLDGGGDRPAGEATPAGSGRDAPPGRLYRTGDLVRWRADGELEFLGRIDQQVKLRGFRIELGEIEAVLALHSEVEEAAVALREDVPGDRRLVAYLVAGAAAAPTLAAELRTFLSERLPDYMVPAAYVILDALPLLPNGKLDRRALPVPDIDAAASRTEYVAPRTPVEQQLASMFAEVVGVERVGVHDNFFELGGHSLLATQLVSRLREAFPVELPLREMFQAPTVAGLGALIAQRLAEQEDEEQLASLMLELEGLSEDEVRAMLADETGRADD